MTNDPTAIGIDLGTTYSVAAIAEGARPRTLARPGAASTVASAVWFDHDRVVVGEEAKQHSLFNSGDVASMFKRKMDDPDWRFTPPGGAPVSATELSAHVLRRLKEDAEAVLGHAVTNAVITVPAHFYHRPRQATIEAARLAGLNVLQLVAEPTAAAVAFGLREDGHALVYDFGGGTFDVTVLRTTGGVAEVLTSDGTVELGGRDYDRRVMQWIASQFRDELGFDPLADAGLVGDLWAAAESAKLSLSLPSASSARVRLSFRGHDGDFTLDRPTFETLTRDLTDRTLRMVDDVLARVGLRPADVQFVLPVGGSSRMLAVREALRVRFNREPLAGPDPTEAVALGAALCAASTRAEPEPVTRPQAPAKSRRGGGMSARPPATGGFTTPAGVRVIDAAPHSLGTIATDSARTRYLNRVIIPKDHPAPCALTQTFRFRTRAAGANVLEIFLTQNEFDDPQRVIFLGLYSADVPHNSSGVAAIEVTYRYDHGQAVAVTATADGVALPVVVRPLPDDVPARFAGVPPQPKPREPLSMVLTIDLSYSMESSIDAVKKAAIERFVERLRWSTDRMAVVGHADRAKRFIDLSPSRSTVMNVIEKLTIGGEVGGCNGQHPFDEVNAVLRGASGRRLVVALADGQWEDQPRAVASAARLRDAGVDIIAVGFGHADSAFLDQLSSGGEGVFTTLDDLDEVFDTIASVFGDDSPNDFGPQFDDTSPPSVKRAGWLKKLGF